MTYGEHLVGNPTLPALHGGTLGALLEAVAQCELLHRAEWNVLAKTITLTIDYLRSGKPVDTFAVAEVLEAPGRRVGGTVQARAFQTTPPPPSPSPPCTCSFEPTDDHAPPHAHHLHWL